MKVYAIRHKTLGWLPQAHSARTRGASHVLPSTSASPRLFLFIASAKNALTQYLRGEQKITAYPGDIETKLEITKIEWRKREDFEIVEFNLVEIKQQAWSL